MLLREGEKTIGVWLPLALAAIDQRLVMIIRMFGDKATRQGLPVPKISEELARWALPLMASTFRQEERNAAEREKFENIKRWARRADEYHVTQNRNHRR